MLGLIAMQWGRVPRWESWDKRRTWKIGHGHSKSKLIDTSFWMNFFVVMGAISLNGDRIFHYLLIHWSVKYYLFIMCLSCISLFCFTYMNIYIYGDSPTKLYFVLFLLNWWVWNMLANVAKFVRFFSVGLLLECHYYFFFMSMLSRALSRTFAKNLSKADKS